MSYHSFIQSRTGDTERGYKCLCCMDAYVISDWLIRKHVDTDHGFDDFSKSHAMHSDLMSRLYGGQRNVPSNAVAAYVCHRVGCDAQWITVDVQEGDRRVSKRVERIRFDAVHHLSAAQCQVIHDANLENMRKGEKPATIARAEVVRTERSSGLQSIGSLMPERGQ